MSYEQASDTPQMAVEVTTPEAEAHKAAFRPLIDAAFLERAILEHTLLQRVPIRFRLPRISP